MAGTLGGEPAAYHDHRRVPGRSRGAQGGDRLDQPCFVRVEPRGEQDRRRRVQPHGVEVVRKPRQAPTVRITGRKIQRFADMVGIREEDLHLSITHSELSAVAVCVVRKER